MDGFPQKLKLARLGAGLSQQELADAIGGISKQMISKYENGLSVPESDKLVRIAKAVGRKPGFLMRRPSFALADVEFRQTGPLLEKQIAQVQAEVAAQLEARIDLEQVLAIERSLKFNLEEAQKALLETKKAVEHAVASAQNVLKATEQAIEQAAEAVRSAWHLGTNPIPNASEMLERQGIHVIATEAPEGFDGMSTWVGNRHGVIVVRDTLPADPFRFRFTLMHELGHLVLNIPDNIHHTTRERMCDRFAGAMLFPAERVREEFGDHRKELFLKEFIEQKCRYGISIAAQTYRLEQAGVIKPALRLKIKKWLYEHEDRRFERNMGSFHSEHCGNYTDQLLSRALAEELITMSKAAEIKNIGLREVRELVREAKGW